jgi:HEXXH motif-containing protein
VKGLEGLEPLLRGFASPEEGLQEEFIETVGVEFARDVTRRFSEQHLIHLGPSAAGLRDAVEAWMASSVGFAASWDPVVGIVGEIVMGAEPLPPHAAAARIGLWLGTSGVPGSWELAVDPPARLRWEHWVLPTAKAVRLDSDGHQAQVTAFANGGREEVVFSSHEGRWVAERAVACPQVPFDRSSISLMFRSAIQAPEWEFLWEDAVSDEEADEVVAGYREAASLLRAHAPEYLVWVDRIMRYVIPLIGAPGRINSGSNRGAPASSHISTNATPAGLAEMLVHESSHQYYYLLTRLGSADDGSDLTEYYSPVKQRGRPIAYILLAYHAFANVLLMTRRFLEAGVVDEHGYLERNEEDLPAVLATLEAGLRQTTALTPIGRALWEPLADRIR